MKYFLIAQTALNFLGAILGKEPVGRLLCVGFGIWGGAVVLLEFFH